MNFGIVVISQDRPQIFRKVLRVAHGQLSDGQSQIFSVERLGESRVAICNGLEPFQEINTVIMKWQIGNMRNLGARYAIEAGAENLIFLDGDCIPQEGWLKEYELLALSSSLIIGCIDRQRENGIIEKDYRLHLSIREAFDQGGGGNFCVSTEAFQAVDGFDPIYNGGWGYEDSDLFRRMIAKGYDWVLGYGALVVHQWHKRETDHFAGLERNRRLYKERHGGNQAPDYGQQLRNG